MRLPISNYRRELNRFLWEYRRTRFGGQEHFFDRDFEPSPTRPPVFKKGYVEKNILVRPGPADQRIVLNEISPKARHKWFGSMRSSQALAQSVFANLKALGKLALLTNLKADGFPLFNSQSFANMRMEHEVQHLCEPRPTNVDVWCDGKRRTAIECKLAEDGIGTCSRPRLTPTAENYTRDYCDGRFALQQTRTERCSLTAVGIAYWHYIPRLFNWSADVDHESCPLNSTYQLVRNVLAACVRDNGDVDPEGGRAVLLYDARNPAFKDEGHGAKAWIAVRASLKNPAILQRCTWQELLKCVASDPALEWLCTELSLKYGLAPGQ